MTSSIPPPNAASLTFSSEAMTSTTHSQNITLSHTNPDKSTTSPMTKIVTSSSDQEVNQCKPDPCIHGNCFYGTDGYLCICDDGYGGTDCEQSKLVLHVCVVFVLWLRLVIGQTLV